MSFTTPIFIPLQSGLDVSKESSLGEKDFVVLENGDFAIDGAIQGRPGKAPALEFNYRTPASTDATPVFSQVAFSATGFTPQGLMRLRDASGERAMLGTRGRLFSQEGAIADGFPWEDRGHFACTRADRLAQLTVGRYAGGPVATGNEDVPPLIGPDFYKEILQAPGYPLPVTLLDGDFSAERSVATSTQHIKGGGSARCGAITAAVFQDGGAGLWITLRNSLATQVTEVQLASDAGGDWTTGQVARVCCDADSANFYVIYKTTTANQYKVLRVTTSGTVLATFTSTLANLNSFWVTNTSVATNKVVIALATTTTTLFKVLTASTMVDLSNDSNYTPAAGGVDCRQVAIGYESATRIWFAIRVAGTYGTVLHIGVHNPTVSPGGATLVKQLEPAPVWSIVHQPLLCGGRMYLTVSAGYTASRTSGVPGVSAIAGNGTCGTWLTLDLSSMNVGSTNGPFRTFTLAARGVGDHHCLTSIGTHLVSSAVLLSDGSGWTFPTCDWTQFGAATVVGLTAGYAPIWVLNRVKFSGPRAVIAGGSTLFSGSVGHELTASGECYEAGFPFCNGTPLLRGNDLVSAGYLTAGDYSLVACWVWTDGSGQVHRSWPSNNITITVNGTTQNAIEVFISNPQLTERPVEQMFLELYATVVNPPADSLHYLQSVVPISNYATAPGTTRVVHGAGSAPDFTSLPLYTDGDEFGNLPVQADGGIAALGRRVWVASADRVYASKLLVPGTGVSWNDEDPLTANLPAGAGRVLALEGLDDKLVVFCERGVFAIPDGGPDNTGNGPDIATPIRLSDLGCAGPRSTCVTDRGVVFCSPLDTTDAQRGGPWLLDRSLSLTERTYLGRPAMSAFLGSAGWVPEVAFSPERQQLYVTSNALASALTGVVVIDLRVGKWSTWSADSGWGAIRAIACVKGVLWELLDNPAAFSVVPGSDYLDDSHAVPTLMTLKTQHIPANGQDGLGWSRVRGVSVLHADNSGAYGLTITAVQDQNRSSNSGSFTLAAPSAATTWPSNRQAPEWRLPVQKCGSIQIQLAANTGTARWSAIRLDVVPLPGRSPTNNRR